MIVEAKILRKPKFATILKNFASVFRAKPYAEQNIEPTIPVYRSGVNGSVKGYSDFLPEQTWGWFTSVKD
jgi:hypothetical protein